MHGAGGEASRAPRRLNERRGIESEHVPKRPHRRFS
ncbi:hypothetical protein BME24068_03875 [Burkholderia metallica]|nr:hypothetical protein BME24068_03875 [Burkholderia metallica]